MIPILPLQLQVDLELMRRPQRMLVPLELVKNAAILLTVGIST